MLSVAERAAIARQDDHYLKLPLQTGSDPASMAAHLRQTVRLLRGDARAAMRYLTGLYERSVPAAALACARGCALCCAQPVAVTALEAFAVAAQVREQEETLAVLQHHQPAPLGAPRSQWRPCVFLDGGKACGVYAARPLSCHGFVSLDLQACIAFFGGEREDTGFMPPQRQQMAYLCRMMLCAAHILAGHGQQSGYELGGAVAAILAMTDAEARWRRGENVLKDLPMGPSVPPNIDAEIRRMAAFVAPTL